MTATTTLKIAGDVQVVVPASIEVLSTYVLEEQQDWFEDEIKAVRSLLQPGDAVIDIGANVGVYALTMAKLVGKTGKVVAFEPAESTRELLRASAELNGFDQLSIDPRGVADRSSAAYLAVAAQSELNQIVTDHAGEIAVESIQLTSLDDWLAASQPQPPIRLIKIDAEGQELNILRGAGRLLSEHAPLILFEIKHGLQLHLELVEAFASHGYRSYRLLPGPQLLEPFDAAQPCDGFLLNLFCCKAETARELAAQGRLILAAADHASADQPDIAFLAPQARYGWQHVLAEMPYAIRQWQAWLASEAAHPDASQAICSALGWHACGMDRQRPPGERARSLHRSVAALRELCIGGAAPLHLASLARAARDAGERALAVEALDSLINALPWMQAIDFAQPFLSPHARFDAVIPQDSLQGWLMAAAIEAHEELRQYSSYFSGPQQRDRLVYALSLGYDSEPLRRRLSLIERRFPQLPPS